MIYAMGRSALKRLTQRDIEAKFPGAEMLLALYRTDPEVVKKILPKPLKPYREPLVMAFIARYPATNFGCVYNEGALCLFATYNGEVGGYCVAMPVTDDMAMVAGREVHGFPKKIAEEISLERTGNTVHGRVVRKGSEIMRMSCELTEKATLSDYTGLFPDANAEARDLKGKPCIRLVSFLFKFFLASSQVGFDYVPRLVRQVSLFRPREDLMKGPGEVVLSSSPYDPLGEVPVRKVEMIGYGTYDNDMLPGRVVGRAWNLWKFLPHAVFKTDFLYTFPEQGDVPKGLADAWRRRRLMKKY